MGKLAGLRLQIAFKKFALFIFVPRFPTVRGK